MSEPRAPHVSCMDIFHAWRDGVEQGRVVPMIVAGDGDLARFGLGPGRVTLLGAPPAYGKTALAMQLTLDALRLNPSLRASVCNVEMSPESLLDRQVARLSGIDLATIHKRAFEPAHAARLDFAFTALEHVADRLSFVSSPFDLATVASAVDEFHADLIVLDYIQRIKPPGSPGDKRGSVDEAMDYLRRFAAEGHSLLVVSAVSRTKDTKGRSSYDPKGLGLASFRESSELEYGADDAYLIAPGEDEDNVVLRHLKSRNDEMRDIELQFNRPLQRFTSTSGTGPNSAGENADLRRAWNAKKPGKGTTKQ